jgi:hypothetical protein
MRLLLALPLLLAATPALAREPGTPPMDARAAARQLNNPLVQGAIAGVVTRLSDAIMDTRLGPLAALTDGADDIAPNDTLGDLAARRDPEYRRHLFERTRGAVATSGRALGAAAAMGDELGRTVARLQDVLRDSGLDR